MDKKPVSLKHIVTTFSAPISEEQAWAILFMAVQKLTKLNEERTPCYLIGGLQDLLVSSDGDIDDASLIDGSQGDKEPMDTFATGIAEIGVAIYEALDWKLDYERKLSLDLERIIDLITSADDSDLQDEGIGIGEYCIRHCILIYQCIM